MTQYVAVSRGSEDEFPLLVGIYKSFVSAAKGCGTFHGEYLLDSGLTDDADEAFSEGSDVVQELIAAQVDNDDIHAKADLSGGGCIIYSVMFWNK